ncbi:MAG TPA: hypothetical protein VG844_13845 [Terracidiphilus sp.]|nr:hypothetical protein [Terracidiphilus sp.]
MATNGLAVGGTNDRFSFQDWLEMAANNEVDDEAIYEYLSPPLPENLVNRWLARISKIENAQRPNNVKLKEWRGRISRAKGRAFERLIIAILKTVRFFESWNNVGTTTNEIDVLVEIGMGCQISPVIREWGTHFICECKLTRDSINATWVGKLNTVLETHNAKVGVLVAAKGPPKGKVWTQIHILSVKQPPCVIVCISLDDLIECQGAGSFLRLVTRRYLEVKVGAANLISG